MPSERLQRARPCGVAHRRNAYFPGNLVRWRFAEGFSGEDGAILIPDRDPRRFRVIAFNLTDKPVTAAMTGDMAGAAAAVPSTSLRPGVGVTPYGVLGSGEDVERYVLRNAHGMTIGVLSDGGSIVGRFANRIAGVGFTRDGHRYALSPDPNAVVSHGGSPGFGARRPNSAERPVAAL